MICSYLAYNSLSHLHLADITLKSPYSSTFSTLIIITIPQQSWESYCFSIVFYYYDSSTELGIVLFNSPTELGIVLFFYCFFITIPQYDSPTKLGIVLFFYCFLLRFPNKDWNRFVFLLFFIITIPQQSWESYCFSTVFYYSFFLYSFSPIQIFVRAISHELMVRYY